MKLNIDVKKKFTVNGKEYASLEEMPADLRRACEAAAVSADKAIGLSGSAEVKTRITFNGKEYESADAMPPEARSIYEKVVRPAIGGKEGGAAQAPRPRPLTPSSLAFSPRWLLVVLAALAAMAAWHYILGGAAR